MTTVKISRCFVGAALAALLAVALLLAWAAPSRAGHSTHALHVNHFHVHGDHVDE